MVVVPDLWLHQFELFGHYKGSVRNANRFFGIVVDEAANLVVTSE